MNKHNEEPQVPLFTKSKVDVAPNDIEYVEGDDDQVESEFEEIEAKEASIELTESAYCFISEYLEHRNLPIGERLCLKDINNFLGKYVQ